MQDIKQLREEFRDKFAIKVTPNNDEDYTKAFLLEKFWKEGTLNDMSDWWLSKLSLAVEQEREKRQEVLSIICDMCNGNIPEQEDIWRFAHSELESLINNK